MASKCWLCISLFLSHLHPYFLAGVNCTKQIRAGSHVCVVMHTLFGFCLSVSPVFDDLRDLRRELIPASANWTNIGIALGLHANVLDSIKTANISNPDACLTSMVTEWLKKNHNVDNFGEPTWRMLVEAVGDPAGGANMELARNMAKRHKAEGYCEYNLLILQLIVLV